jgi:DNA-binding PadR family transcriptional regulator
MAVPSEVKIRIRSNALTLREFTVAQMRRVTGLNPASIRTELQRMKREGYLTSEPMKERRGRGAPAHIYKLTADSEKRLELSYQVEAFYTPAPPPAPPKPTSLHFKAAVKLIDRLAAGQASEEERDEVPDKARYHLDFAMHEEGVGIKKDEATDIIGAHIDFRRAQLECLQGRWPEAETLLNRARAVFLAHELEAPVAQVEAYLLCLAIRPHLEEAKEAEASSPSAAAWCIQKAVDELESSPVASHPLAQTLLDIACWLRESLQAREMESAAKQLIKELQSGFDELMERAQRREREGIGPIPGPTTAERSALPYYPMDWTMPVDA